MGHCEGWQTSLERAYRNAHRLQDYFLTTRGQQRIWVITYSRVTAKTLKVWLQYSCLPANVLFWKWKVSHWGKQTLPWWEWDGESRPQDPEPAKTHFTHFDGFGNIKCRPTCTHAQTSLLLLRWYVLACFAEVNIMGSVSQPSCLWLYRIYQAAPF